MSVQPPKFGINLILAGVDKDSDPDAAQNIEHELSMRSHIENYQVSWANENKSEITAYIEMEGSDQKLVEKQVAEELFEVACAVLRKLNGIKVEIIRPNVLQ